MFIGTPPDSTGAIGRTHYVEMANSIIHVWGRDLSTVSSSTLANFIGQGSGVPFCDPQIQWDPTADRWLVLFLYCNTTDPTNQFFFYGWSKTADPSDLVSGWCLFGEFTGSNFFDYPKLGHNSLYMIFGGNFYGPTPSANPPFEDSAIVWAALPANGVTTCSSGGVNGMSQLVNGDGVTQTFTPVPVNTITNAADGYIVSSYDVGGNVQAPAPQTKLAVWHLDSGGILHQDADVSVVSYAMPPAAAQLGSTNKIDTLDGRLTQAVGDPTTGIWTQHTVANGALAMVAWYQLTTSGTNLVNAQEGIVASASDSIFNAAISPSTSGRGTVVEYSRSSSTIDPVIAAQGRFTATAAGQMEPGEIVLASSSAADAETLSCNVGGFPCRWGDYSAATPDPLQPDVVWGTNEFNTSNSSTPSWSNENFALVAGPPPGAPTITSAAASDGFACVRWTPSAFNSGADVSYTIRAYHAGVVARSLTINAPATISCVSGLTNGTAYTLTVAATNLAGAGPESAPSAPVTPLRGATGSPPIASSSRTPVKQGPGAPIPVTR
jgi:hypothetical protein